MTPKSYQTLIAIIGIVVLLITVPASAEPLQPVAAYQVLDLDCDVCPRVIVVPGGRFTLGDTTGQGDADELPTQEVTVGRFAIGQFEVSFGEYDIYVRETGADSPPDLLWGRNNRPVIHVSWDDAHQYLEWLSRKSGREWRLPTEAEWQYAAKQGGTDFENDMLRLCDYANHADASTRYRWRNIGCRDGSASITSPVGKYRPNNLGIHDMHGNVYEWVADCYAPSLADHPLDGTAFESKDCLERVMMGGSWYNDPRNVRASNRSSSPPDARQANVGFRVVLELD